MTYDDEEEEEEELSDAGWGVLGGLAWAFLFRKKPKDSKKDD